MKIINDKIEPKALISKLKPHPANPRNGDTEAIGSSVRENGFYGVVVAQLSTGHILAGNHRYHVALEAGAKTLPVAWVDVDDAKALDILLSDNRTSDLAKQDDGLLAELLVGIAEDRGLVGTGYNDEDLSSLLRIIESTGQKPLNTSEEWQGMPEFESNNLGSKFRVTVHFPTLDDAESFFSLIDRPKQSSMWWPQNDSHIGSTVKEAYVEKTKA